MDTAQEFIDRVAAALQYPADDTYATTLVVLIVLAAAVVIALMLIALGLPSRDEPREHPDRDAGSEADDSDG